MPVMNMIQALNQTLHQQFAKRAVSHFRGRCRIFWGSLSGHRATGEIWGERGFDTPLAEPGIVGFGIGMAKRD